MTISDIARRPILVTGLPRSGTSLVAGSLQQCGAFLGHTVAGSEENPKGFFENTVLRQEVVKRILNLMGCDPLGVQSLPPLQPVIDLPAVENFAEDVVTLLADEGYSGQEPWLFKDAKLSLIWPIWSKAFPQARWVIVRRRHQDVIRSCLGAHFMVQHSSDPAFWQRFIEAYERRLEVLCLSGVWYREITPAELVAGDLGPLQELAGELGLKWRPEQVARFISPEHWHAAGQ